VLPLQHWTRTRVYNRAITYSLIFNAPWFEITDSVRNQRGVPIRREIRHLPLRGAFRR